MEVQFEMEKPGEVISSTEAAEQRVYLFPHTAHAREPTYTFSLFLSILIDVILNFSAAAGCNFSHTEASSAIFAAATSSSWAASSAKSCATKTSPSPPKS